MHEAAGPVGGTDRGERRTPHTNRRSEVLGMNMPWMVVVLVATLVVIVASVGVAATADAVSRRRVHRSADTAAADPESPLRTVDAASRVHDWHRLAVPAWMTCVGASALAVAVIGVLIVVG